MPATNGLRSNTDSIVSRNRSIAGSPVDLPPAGSSGGGSAPAAPADAYQPRLTLSAEAQAILDLSAMGLLELVPQNANEFLAGPASGSPSAPIFRALVGDDLPLAAAPASPVSNDTLIRITIDGQQYDILAVAVSP